jgi:ABC-type transporter Mla subunit MlaD
MAEKAVEKEVKEEAVAEKVEALTEDSLLKSIQDLEAKKEEPKADPEPDVKTAELEKSAKDAVETGASEDLKKALDVSETLKEFADLIGTHVDDSLTALQKSVQSGAERDLAIVRVLKSLGEKVEALGDRIETYGQEPTSPAKAREIKAKAEEVLEKSAGVGETGEAGKPDFTAARGNIMAGLETLVKNADSPDDANKYTHSLIKFETTGELSESDFAAAQNAWKKAQA